MIDSLKLLLRLNTKALYEDVSTTTMFAYGGTNQPIIIGGGGYAMVDDQMLKGEGPGYSGYKTDITTAFTLGFWLYPVSPGMTTNSVTGDAVSVTMPLMDFNNFSSTDVPIIKLTEQTTSDGENNLRVSLNDDAYYASSEDYTPLMWHHFWIVYDGASGLSIYVDGKQHVLQDENGSLPVSIDGARLDLYINHNLDGYASNIAKNLGYISEIFMLDVANSSVVDMQRVINDGVNYLVDDSYTDIYIDKSNIYFNDPDTITVTSSIDDMSYVYLGRNDGKILRGSPLLWETRRTFARDGETKLLGLSTSDSGWRIVNGFLELTSESIRL